MKKQRKEPQKEHKKMTKQQQCPQCGTQLYNEYYTSVVCPICGWGKNENVTLTPSSGLSYKLSTKSKRWKFGVVAVAIIALLVITPLIKFSRNQLLANQAVATARAQMEKRLYASAVRTLNGAPRSQVTSNTKSQLISISSDTVRWAHDISDAKTAKASLLEGDSEDALENLDDIDEDFPQVDEADELGDMAQEMEIDDDYDVTEDELDDTFYIPDDPEMDNLDDLETEASEFADDDGDDEIQTTTNPGVTPSAPATDNSPAPEEAGDDPEGVEPGEDELPEAPVIDNKVPANAPANKTSRLVHLYQILWDTPKDRDNFYTIDVKNEVDPGKDAKSNFTGYKKNGAIGQVYNRKLTGNKSVIPLYRYWSAKDTNHFYTTSRNFASKSNNNKYVRQQVAAYVGKWDGQKCLAGNKPLYTIYSAKMTNNIYTANPDVKNQLVANGDYKNPKIIGCIW